MDLSGRTGQAELQHRLQRRQTASTIPHRYLHLRTRCGLAHAHTTPFFYALHRALLRNTLRTCITAALYSPALRVGGVRFLLNSAHTRTTLCPAADYGPPLYFTLLTLAPRFSQRGSYSCPVLAALPPIRASARKTRLHYATRALSHYRALAGAGLSCLSRTTHYLATARNNSLSPRNALDS